MGELVETDGPTDQQDTKEGEAWKSQGQGQRENADRLFLSRTAMTLFEMSPDDDIYQFIAETLSALVPDSVIMVNSYEERYSTLHLRALRGVGKELQALLKILGNHPIGLSAPLGQEAKESLGSGTLQRMPAGLYELTSSGVRKEVSRGVERLLGSGNLYAMGLVCKGHLCGSVAVLAHKDGELANARVIESFGHQAAVALHRWGTERTLRQANIDLETRIAERTRELTDANRRLRFEVIERQQTEEKLQKERTTLNKLMNLNPYAISTYDARGRYLQGNQAFIDLFGGPLPAEYSLFSDPILEQNGYRSELLNLTSGQTVSIRELWYNPHAVGSALPDKAIFLRGLAFPVMDRDGNLECVVAMLEDITARKQAEDELRLKNSALASSVDAVALADLEGHLTYVNAAYLKLWGYDDENEVIGRPAADFWQAEEQVATIMTTVVEEGSWRGEAIAMRKDGTAFVAELAAGLVGNGDGNPTWLMASFVDVTERKRLAEMVRESEELFRGMLGSATVGMYIVQGGRFIYVNEQFETMTGLTIAELSGTISLERVHPDDREMVRRKAREQLKGESDLPYEYRFMGKDGKVLWILERVASIVYKGQLAAVGSFMDVTELRLTERQLTKSEEKHRSLVETANAGIVTTKVTGEIEFANAAVCAMTGYSRDELIGKPFAGFLNPDDRPGIMNAFLAAVGGVVTEALLEFRVTHKDGYEVWFQSSPTVVKHGDEAVGFTAIIHDITERKLAEERFRTLIENASDVIVILDSDGTIQYLSPCVQRLLGYKPEEVVGEIGLNLVHPDDTRNVGRTFAALVAKPGSVAHVEVRIRHKDGSWHTFDVVGRNLLGDAAVDGIVANFHDITERKLAEEALKHSEVKFRSAIESARDGIMILDMDGRIVDVNDTCLAAMECDSREGVLGHSAVELLAPKGLEELGPNVVESLRQDWRVGKGYVTNIELVAIGRHGREIPVEISMSRMSDDEGQPMGAIVVVRDITERKRGEQELRESEEKLRLLFESVTDGIAAFDLNGVYTEVNQRLVEMHRLASRDEMLGKKVFEFTAERDREKGMANMQKALRSGSVVQAEYTALRADGSEFPCEVSGALLKDASGDPIGFIATVRDVTERRQAEDALRASEERYRLLVENGNDAIIVAQEGMLKYFNHKALEVTGYTDEEMSAKPFIEIVHPDDRQMVAERHLRRLQGEEFAHVYPFRVIDKAGNVRWVEIRAVMINWEGGPATLNFLSDITERRNAEEELRQRKERFKALIENASDAVAIVDADGVILYESPSVERMLGYTPEELIGTGVFDLIHPDDLPDVAAGFAENLVDENAGGGPQELRLRHKDGSWRWVEGIARNLLDNPHVRGIVANYRDITERHQADEALRESERLYRLVADNASDVIWTMDLNLRYTYVSPAVTHLLGYTPEETLALTLDDLMDPCFIELAANTLAEELAIEQAPDLSKSRTLEMQQKRKDGSRVWVESTMKFIRDAQGNRIGISGVSRDITERKRAEEALRESEHKYRTLLETGATPVYWVEVPDGTITYVNRKAEELFGRDKEDLVGHSLLELVPGDEVALHQAKMREAASEMRVETQPVPQVIVRPDGECRYTEVYPNMFRSEGKVVAQVVCTDVTERNAAEEALRDSEERFRRVVQNAPDIIFRWSVEDGLEYVSPRVLEVTGYTAEEVVGDPMLGSEIARGIELDSVGAEEASAEGAALPSREFVFARKDGSEAYLEIRSVPVVDDEGTVIGLEGILRDVTQRRWAEELLRRSEEFSTSLLANSPNPILVINPDTSVRYVNPALEELTGFAAAELVGTGPPYLWWAEESVVKTGWDPSDAITRGAQGLEQLCKKKNGERFWIELTAAPVVRDGELAYYLATWIDITERKRAGEALHHSEYKYRTALESARDGVLILDTNATIVDANRTCVASVGYEYKEQLVGRSVFDIVASEAPEEIRTHVTEMLNKHGYITNFEVAARARDGKEIPVEVNMSQLLDERGQVTGSILVIRDVTERKRAQQEILRHAKRLEALHAISASVSQTLDLDEMLNITLARVLEVVELDGGFIHLLDSEAKQLVLKAWTGISDEHAAALERMEVGEEAMQRWHDYPEPAFRTERILAKEAHDQVRSASREDGVVTSVSVPLWSKSVMHGGLSLLSRIPRRFWPEELDLLKAIGNEIAVGIENAKLLERTKELSATDELTGLHNRRQFFEILESEINRMQRYGGFFTLAMLDLDEFKEYNDRFGHTNGDAVLRCVAQTLTSELRKPDMAFRYGGDEFTIILPETDAEKAKGIVDRIRSRRLEGLREGTAPPDLYLNFSAGIAQFPDNAETADGLVFLADTALYRSKRSGGNKTILVADLGEAGADVVDSATMDQVYALAATVDARDPHTYGHSKRVATISEMMGRAIGLQPIELADLRAAALLHDIGKVGVPDSILTKPGVPNKHEWTVLRKHPGEGAKIVGYVKELQRLVPLVRHHHEWYDGSGYPDGLKGEDIPLGARIISVADAYDTMTTPRPYREVVSPEEACAELRRCSGTQFEEALAEALCRAVNEAGEQTGAQTASAP